jgi:hypothetical protein
MPRSVEAPLPRNSDDLLRRIEGIQQRKRHGAARVNLRGGDVNGPSASMPPE